MSDREKAFQNSKRNHMQNKRRIDRNRKLAECKVNDLVYVSHGNQLNRHKMEELRIGPLKILKKISNVIFKIDSRFLT